MPRDVAVVLPPDLDAARQAGRLDAFPRVVELLVGNGDSCDLGPALLGGVLGEAAPAAADLQDVLAVFDLRCIGDGRILGRLRVLQADIEAGKAGGGVGHAAVEPLGIEVVAKVVVLQNVAPRAAPGVRTQQVIEPGRRAVERGALQADLPVVEVDRSQTEEDRKVRRVALAGHVALGEAVAAAEQHAAEHALVVDDQLGVGPRLTAIEAAPAAVGQSQIELAGMKAAAEGIDHHSVA